MALPWLYGVARGIVSDHYRSQNRRGRLASLLSGIRPRVPTQRDWEVVQRAEYSRVHAALEALRPKDREVLLLAAWEELSNEQIAETVGCTPEAAAQRVSSSEEEARDHIPCSVTNRPISPPSK